LRGRPLLPIRGVMSILDRSEDAILAMLDEGQLLWAWNLALDPARSRRKALHVLPACVDDVQSGRECRLEKEEVLKLLLPHNGQFLLATDLQHCLNVTES